MTNNTKETGVEEKYDKLVLELMGQSAFSAYVGSFHHAKIKAFIHQELQKALAVQAIQIREEEADEYNKIIERELQKARAEVKYEVIKLLAGNTPIYEKRKASAYNEGVTSGWYAAREFIRLELNAQQIQSELDHFNK